MNPILQAMETVREQALTEKELVPFQLSDATDETLALIGKCGGIVEQVQWQVTCQSETCFHTSHPEGWEKASVAVPKAWLPHTDSTAVTRLFMDVTEADTLLFIIPCEETGPRAVVKRRHQHPWFPSTLALSQNDALWMAPASRPDRICATLDGVGRQLTETDE